MNYPAPSFWAAFADRGELVAGEVGSRKGWNILMPCALDKLGREWARLWSISQACAEGRAAGKPLKIRIKT